MFLIRKIHKGGRIRMLGKWWHVSEQHMPYDGRLDGMHFVFGLYENRGETYDPPRDYLPFAALWGTASAYYDESDPDFSKEDCACSTCKFIWPGPQCVDGHFVWDSWWEDGYDHERSMAEQRAGREKSKA